MELTLCLGKRIQTLDSVANAALELNRLSTNADTTLGNTRAVDCADTLCDDAVAQVFELSLGEHGLHADLLAVDAFDPGAWLFCEFHSRRILEGMEPGSLVWNSNLLESEEGLAWS